MAHAILEADIAADKKKIAVLSGLPQTRLIYVDHVEYPYLALCLICVAQTSDSGRRACRTWHSVGTKKRLRRTHWLPEKTTMNNLVYATARRKNLGRARSVSEIPATGQLPGRRDIRRVGRSVVNKKNTRPAAPTDPHAHFERVGHELAGPHSHHIRVVRTNGRRAFSLRTCMPRSARCALPLPTCCRRSGQ